MHITYRPATAEDLKPATRIVQDAYNAAWLIERHGFRPPSADRRDQLSTAARAA